MNIHTASNLDIERFRKVYALVANGATEGERAAAKARASKIAAKAGMSFNDAVSKLDEPKPKPTNFFEGFDDWMEAKEPGYKEREAKVRSKKEEQRRKQQQELLKVYGSENALFAETDQERLLRVTLEPLADRSEYHNCSDTYISGYAGWTCRKPTPPLWEAIERAYPLPTNIQAAWSEYQHWQQLCDARYTFDAMHETPIWVRAREAALEYLMDTAPAQNPDDFHTRLIWLEHLNGREYSRDIREDSTLIATMRTDFEYLSQSIGKAPSAQNGADLYHQPRRTNADKRVAVMSMLDTQPELSDREISRRLGVSPQTVGNWRRRIVA